MLTMGSVASASTTSWNGLAGVRARRKRAANRLKGLKSESTEVHEVMSANVICADLTLSVLDCMELMSDKKVRHLPVMDQKQLIGILSIGDLVKAIIEAQRFQIEQLEQYIKS